MAPNEETMNQDSLFEEPRSTEVELDAPLAARMRPQSFDEISGQAHLVAPAAAFRRAAEAGKLGSVILWGPPGVGKTTIAKVIANTTKARFERISAVSAGVADLRKIVERARVERKNNRRTLLFIDEIHRFNKAQQDAILPVVEDGTVTLIGATTENPSFEVNSALLSRSRVFVLTPLQDEDIAELIQRAVEDSVRGLPPDSPYIEQSALHAIIGLANGDARSALNMLELATSVGDDPVTVQTVESAIQRRALHYDKGGEQHYDLISALHKTVRGSDVDASLYWLARILESGEDPMYVARRVVRMATEDIGLADPFALGLCVSAQQAVHFIGMPEGALALAQAVAYLCLAPKSNSLYLAYKQATADVLESRNDPVPLHLRNAPTRLMKELSYGEGYRYAHDFADGLVAQQNLPDSMSGRTYYRPSDRGQEVDFSKTLEKIRKIYEE